MDATLWVCKGMNASYKNAINITIEEALQRLQTRTDCFELLNNNGFNRIYGDIDLNDEGKRLVHSWSEQEFNKVDEEIREALESFLSKPYCLMTSSSFLHKKISWRFVLPKQKLVLKEDNKQLIKNIKNSGLLKFPNGVELDTKIYDTNRKMRMLGSNKDGENRPLRLVVGEPIDTLITYIPEDCEEVKVEYPVESKKKSKPKKNEEPTILTEILSGLSDKRFDDYDEWVKIGMICFSEDVDISVWEEASKRSAKYKAGDCESKWKTFKKNGGLTLATLWEWLKEDNVKVWESLKQSDYVYQKEKFEETHFKLIDPPVYVRLGKSLTILKDKDLRHCYNNFFCGDKLFIDLWIKDPAIRTYEELVYKPKQKVADNVYNIYEDFKAENKEGDIRSVLEVLNLVSGNDEKVATYIEKWLAWIIQTPYKKTGTCIVIQGEQGIGKDTYFDFVGRMFGEYYYNTNRAEEDVFTRFNGHLKKTLFMKFEEASWLANKKNESSLKSLITCSKMSFEDKGLSQLTLDSYVNIVMTTNVEVPVSIEPTDRRFVLVKGSSEKRTNMEFWNRIHASLENPDTLSAYYHRLLNLDLTGFNPRDRPITEYYEEVKQSFTPYHAKWFQNYICLHCEHNDEDSFTFRANELLEKMKQSVSFDINQTQLGRHLKLYPDNVLHKNVKRYGAEYTITSGSKMREFLIQQKWWIE